MNDREQRIWDAAYDQAFVACFNRTWHQWDKIGVACERTRAELPAEIADLAIIRLREWQKTEDVNVGTHVQEKWPEEYGIDPEGLIGTDWPKSNRE